MKPIENAPEQDSRDGLVIESKNRHQSAEKTDPMGLSKHASARVIQTASGEVAEMFRSDVFAREVRAKLRAGEVVTVNAKNAALSAEDIAAIHAEAARNNQEGGKGTIRIADVQSGQQKELHDKLAHLGVEAVTHEQVFNVLSAEDAKRKVELRKKNEEEAPEESFEGMKA